jgi:hypothetical protein
MRGYHKRREVKNCRKAREDKIKRERRTAGSSGEPGILPGFFMSGKSD